MNMQLSKRFSAGAHASPGEQRGAVLLTGLVLLFVVTLFGVSGMQTITLDERIVSNLQSANVAFHGAEGALSVCEANLQDQSVDVYALGSFPADWYDSAGFWAAAGKAATFADGLARPPRWVQSPRCVVEYIGNGGASQELNYEADNASAKHTYRVSSLSKGADMSTEAILESVFICSGGCGSEADVEAYGGP